MQAGLLLDAVALGISFTDADVVAVAVHPLVVLVATTVYVPELPATAPRIEGFCNVLEKPPGPVHAKVAPLADELKFRSEPVQIGPLLEAETEGPILIETEVLEEEEQPPGIVTTTI